MKVRIRSLIEVTGACRVGFAACHDTDMAAFDRWLEAGMNGEMEYMVRNRHLRLNPAGLLEGCRTVISIAYPYFQAGQPRSPFFADYAVGDDYHDVLREVLRPVCSEIERLAPGSATHICVDSAPVLERAWAVEAGVGFIGLNHQLIVPGIGSKVFLCEILWTGTVEPDAPCEARCDGCGRCMEACPGKALGPDGLDARRCLSYLTVEYRGDLPEGLRLPGRICGCDICQDVCPHNAAPPSRVRPEFRPRASLLALSRDEIAAMAPTTFSTLFRRSAVKRLKLHNLLRNLAHS